MRQRLEKTTWVPVPDLGFELQLRYVSRKDLTGMVEAATESSWSRRVNGPVEKLNSKKLVREYAKAILDWREKGLPGMSRETYGRLIAIDPSEYPEVIPCTEEYKLELLEEAWGFDTVVRQLTQDLQIFQDEKLADEVKN